MSEKRGISFIGSGNVATQLAAAFDRAGHSIHQIISRNVHSAGDLAKKFGAYFSNDMEMLYKNIDLIVVAVSDDEIPEIAQKLRGIDVAVCHTSGSVPMSALRLVGNDYGVLYPLQTFSKTNDINFEETPFLIEGCNQDTYELLRDLAESLSQKVSELDSEQRKKLHLSAVVVNNFSNHLFYLASEYLKQENIPFEHLVPLIQETAKKMITRSPKASQTGPAKRDDQDTIKAHLELLRDNPELQDIYKSFSESITRSHRA